MFTKECTDYDLFYWNASIQLKIYGEISSTRIPKARTTSSFKTEREKLRVETQHGSSLSCAVMTSIPKMTGYIKNAQLASLHSV